MVREPRCGRIRPSSTIPGDEAEALVDIEPFHGALGAPVAPTRFAQDSCRREMDSNFRFRASGDTPHRPRGEAASHRSRLPLRRDPPSGRDLDDGTVSQLLEELAGEMNRPSDRKRRISGYGDRTWRRN